MTTIALCLDRRMQERVATEATASGHVVTTRTTIVLSTPYENRPRVGAAEPAAG